MLPIQFRPAAWPDHPPCSLSVCFVSFLWRETHSISENKSGESECCESRGDDGRLLGHIVQNYHSFGWEIWRAAKWMDKIKNRERWKWWIGLYFFPLWGQPGQTETDMYDQAVGRAAEWGSCWHAEERALMYSGDDKIVYCRAYKTMRKCITLVSLLFSLLFFCS